MVREGVVATMAKQNPVGGERSKVRMLYVEGEFAPGEIQTLAMTFARPSTAARPAQKRIVGSSTENGGALDAEQEIEIDVEEVGATEDNGATAGAAPRASRGKRTYPTPPTVEMDMAAGGMPFKDFAATKGPKSNRDRYLAAAAWSSEYAKLPSITTGHVRTCYIAAGWTYKVNDPIAPFRILRDDGLGTLSDGNFAIGHLGLAEVQEMAGGTTA